MKSDFLIAVTQLAAERKLPKDRVISAIEAALVSAYRKENAPGQSIAVKLDPGTGEVRVFTIMTVVEKIEDPHAEMSLAEASKLKNDAAIGDIIEIETTPQHSGRIAAQTAKQVVMQRLREAEKDLVYEEYTEREGEIVTGTLQRIDRAGGRPPIIVDIDRTEATLPPSEQVENERYRFGQKLKLYILEVKRTTKGPEIITSRTHKDLVRRLFELEVPEIYNGAVEIKAIAREPGARSKVAVASRQNGVDPVGSCVGQRGIRIQNIVNELQGEKIDVIQWHSDPVIFISHALSPAQPLRVDISDETATVVVPDKQLSLAIGKEGQNARLAAKLTGWKVDIKSASEAEDERLKQSLEGRPIAAAKAATAEAERSVPIDEVIPVELETDQSLTEQEPVPAVAEEEAAAIAPPDAPTGEEPSASPETLEESERISPEEELIALEQSEQESEVIVAETPQEVEEEITEDVWQIPAAVPQTSQIRFAEDIMVPRGVGRGRGRKKARRPRHNAAPGKSQRGRQEPQQQVPSEEPN